MEKEIKFLKRLKRELKKKAEPNPIWCGWGYIEMMILARISKLEKKFAED